MAFTFLRIFIAAGLPCEKIGEQHGFFIGKG